MSERWLFSVCYKYPKTWRSICFEGKLLRLNGDGDASNGTLHHGLRDISILADEKSKKIFYDRGEHNGDQF